VPWPARAFVVVLWTARGRATAPAYGRLPLEGRDGVVGARRYTEQQFRAAVADPQVRTMADLCRALGLVPRGGNYETVRWRGRQLGVDVDHELAWRRLGCGDAELRDAARTASTLSDLLRVLDVPVDGHRRQLVRARMEQLGLPERRRFSEPRPRPRPAARTYTDRDLLAALDDPDVDGYRALCRRLGLEPHTKTYERLRRRAHHLGTRIPAVWSRPGRRPGSPHDPSPTTSPPWPEQQIRDAVEASLSLTATLRALGSGLHQAAYARLRECIAAHGIDTSHFRADGGAGTRRRQAIDQLLQAGRPVNSTVLRRRLIEEGLKEHRCEACLGTTWRDHPTPLELDHVNGDRFDNRLANLRLLCPNCHALTPTYRGKNMRRGDGPPQPF
jgi:hypothetical protein